MVALSVDAKEEVGGLSERGESLKARLLSSPYEIDIERALIYTESWKETEAEAPCMRAAIALARTLERMSIRIEDDERIAGVKTAKNLAGVIPVERGEFNTVIEMELDRLTSRERHRFHIEEKEKQVLEGEILPYWKGRSVREKKIELWKREGIYQKPSVGPITIYRIIKAMGPKVAGKIGYQIIGGSLRSLLKVPKMQRELAGLRPSLALTVFDVQGHFVPGYRRVLDMGFEGISETALKQLEKLEAQDEEYDEKKDFLESVRVVSDAVIGYSNRYADLAEDLAAGAGAERSKELLAIAKRCRKVPAEPPESFVEAVQSLWMSQVAFSISYGMAAVMSPGRVDQYLYPYYESDLRAGRITREQALEILEEYLVKISTYLIMLIEVGKDTASEMAVGSNTITVGGLDEEGRDATNELSYLFIEAHDNLKSLANNLSVRVSSLTPPEFLKRACGSYRSTSGMAIFNDQVIVDELEADGYAREDARDYSIVGCVEPTSTGNTYACTAGNDISLAGVLEMTLNRGRMLFEGRQVGYPTEDPSTFRSFEDVKRAFTRQLSFNIDKLVNAVELLDEVYAREYPNPLVSSACEGCLENCRDVTRGGARYNYGSITARGLGTVANSLAAIQWAVFDRRLLSMPRLIRLLAKNFRGEEAIRQQLLRHAPKYGNDESEADEIAEWLTGLFCEEVRKHSCGRGGFYRPGMFSYGVHVVDGLYLGATPDGRLAGEPVSNGISPVNGTERNGPTAVMRSAVRAAGARVSDGTALNMRLSPTLFEREENVWKLSALVKGYFEMGGRHVQFNVVDTETLKDAQEHPERYPDLVVRVSGYCAYFTDLGRSIQDDIIARTDFGSI